MSPEEKALLENTLAIAKENNEMLRSLQRRARLGLAWKVTYWVVIIGISLGAFYFIQPYVDLMRGLTGNETNARDSYSQQIQELLK